jgi:uncharacterized membrane protein
VAIPGLPSLPRARPDRHPANQLRHGGATVGERVADRVTARFGSWTFILAQSAAIVVWIGANVVGVLRAWDPYPFILLNLLFSTQAAYAAPLILLSQNRQAERDRVKAEHDYAVNQLALQFLLAWHRDAHPPGCRCVAELGPDAERVLGTFAHAGTVTAPALTGDPGP